ncbi:MAG TPA: transglutaminase domain-containing protein [Bacillota bacterium]|nr:transglutaminase domain-containing protein [Bacillota bacterium]
MRSKRSIILDTCYFIALVIICLFLGGCPAKKPVPATVGTIPPSQLKLPYISPMIDYHRVETCLKPGKNSTISPDSLTKISGQLKIKSANLDGVKTIYQWIRKNFKIKHAQGKYIGQRTVNDLIRDKIITGCFDGGLLWVSLLRSYGYPAVMVDAVGIDWLSHSKRMIVTHVFIECYVNRHWILIDSITGEYIEDYQLENPVIPVRKSGMESKGFYAMLKGLDPDDFGIHNVAELSKKSLDFAADFDTGRISYPKYHLKPMVNFFSFKFEFSFKNRKK